MTENKKQHYATRFNQVFDYIDKHLDDNLSVEQLSQIANFSKFHFHRQFSEYAGISVFRYIQMMRLRRASYRLVFSADTRIIDIAIEAGFENPESFSRAFKQIFSQTPSQFRKQPAWKPWHEQYRPPQRPRTQPMQVNIINFNETPIAVFEHRGAPELINDSVKVFINWRKQTQLSPTHSSNTFGIAYDNPDTVAPGDFRFDICGSVITPIPDNAFGVINKVIPGGRCAVLRHHGPHNRIGECAYYLYREWLPESGEELRDFPLFFHYINLITETPEHELITDVYLPLK